MYMIYELNLVRQMSYFCPGWEVTWWLILTLELSLFSLSLYSTVS